MFKDKQSYIVLDVETGGLDPNTHSILEISGILWEPGRKIQPVFDCYVKEENIVTVPRAMEVNQINLDKVNKQGRSPKEAVYYIKNRLMGLF